MFFAHLDDNNCSRSTEKHNFKVVNVRDVSDSSKNTSEMNTTEPRRYPKKHDCSTRSLSSNGS